MYSTLEMQENLTRIPSGNYHALNVLNKKLKIKNSEFYLLVRNPILKIESFFKDKFRIAVKKNEAQGKWQDCQKIFFPYLNLNENMPANFIAQKLTKTTFSEMIAILPEVYLKDAHLIPQSYAIKANFDKYGFKFNLSTPFNKIFKIEDKNDLNEVSTLFNLNFKIVKNSTKTHKEKIEWAVDDYEIVKKIYNMDFKNFKYNSNIIN